MHTVSACGRLLPKLLCDSKGHQLDCISPAYLQAVHDLCATLLGDQQASFKFGDVQDRDRFVTGMKGLRGLCSARNPGTATPV